MSRHALAGLLAGLGGLLLTGASTAGSFSKLFAEVSPAVVILHTFEQGPPKIKGKSITTATVEGVGSGVLISDDGKILTAAHVVHLAESIHVEFHDGTKALARVLASDTKADVALVKIDEVPDGAVVAKLGDSDPVRVGDEIVVIGAPYGIGHTLTVGHVSGRRLADDDSVFSGAEFFQTDASINQGNSGGPMFNADGEVVGIVSYILSRSGGFEGMGFAVTANTARGLLIEQRGFWSGVEGQPLTGGIAKAFNLPQQSGYLVQRVAKGSPLDRAGVKGGKLPIEIAGQEVVIGGDVVLEVAGIEVGADGARSRLREKLRGLDVGTEVEMKVLRAGRVERLRFAIPEGY